MMFEARGVWDNASLQQQEIGSIAAGSPTFKRAAKNAVRPTG